MPEGTGIAHYIISRVSLRKFFYYLRTHVHPDSEAPRCRPQIPASSLLPLTRRRVSWVCPLFKRSKENTMPELASNGNEL